MLRIFLDDPLFGGLRAPGFTGSLGLTDITFAGRRPCDATGGRGRKIHWPRSVSQQEEPEMPHKFSQETADRLVAIRRGIDRGTHTEADLIAARMKANGLELDDAMEQYAADDYGRW